MAQVAVHGRMPNVGAVGQEQHRPLADRRRELAVGIHVGRVPGHKRVHDNGTVRLCLIGCHTCAAQPDFFLNADDARKGPLQRLAHQPPEEFQHYGAADPIVDRLAADTVGITERHKRTNVCHGLPYSDAHGPNLLGAVGPHIDIQGINIEHSTPLLGALQMARFDSDDAQVTAHSDAPPNQHARKHAPQNVEAQKAGGLDALDDGSYLIRVCRDHQVRSRGISQTPGVQVAHAIDLDLVSDRTKGILEIAHHILLEP